MNTTYFAHKIWLHHSKCNVQVSTHPIEIIVSLKFWNLLLSSRFNVRIFNVFCFTTFFYSDLFLSRLGLGWRSSLVAFLASACFLLEQWQKISSKVSNFKFLKYGENERIFIFTIDNQNVGKKNAHNFPLERLRKTFKFF